MTKLKMFEQFGEDKILFPWDEDAGMIDLNNEEDFLEFKDNTHFNLKYSSEDILKIIGIDNDTIWFDMLNRIGNSISADELDENLNSIREFLENFNEKQVEEINLILNKQ
jgi:hypothetical protein